MTNVPKGVKTRPEEQKNSHPGDPRKRVLEAMVPHKCALLNPDSEIWTYHGQVDAII